MTEQTEESLLSRLHRTVLMEVATGGIANGLDTVMAGAHGTDVTGLSGANVGHGSALHHGPADGGELLDRPSAGYMAHASTQQGVAIEPQGEEISHIARGMNDAGTMTVDGQTIQVLDYMPGGDMVQMAAGQVDPGQMLMKIAQHGISEEVEKSGGDGMSMERAIGSAPAGQETVFTERGSSGQTGIHDHMAPDDMGTQHDRGADGNHAGIPEHDVSNGAAGTAGRMAAKHALGQHIPDADENARDLEALALQHRLDVDTAIQTSDHSEVHTQMHAHGRTLEIDTDFDATKPSNDQERSEASEHVTEVARGGHDEVNLDEPGMHMRSRIAAHLDAASRDEGISM